jgi:hypothetical protein
VFRYASDVYGQTVLVGASWDLIWWFLGAGAAFIVLHALIAAVARPHARVRSAGT